MLKIIQSQRIERLFAEMLGFFAAQPLGIFESRQILIPSHGVGVWLKLYLASQQGIAAQVSTDFIGAFQWELYGRLADREQNLAQKALPQAPLSSAIMRWKIFAYIWHVYQETLSQHAQTAADIAEHDDKCVDRDAIQALDFLLKKLVTAQHHAASSVQQAQNDAEIKRKVWTLSAQIAQVFASYVVYRPAWLRAWGRGEHLSLTKMADDQPDWLVARYAEMQIWQAWLWKTLFAETFEQRETEIAQFWATLKNDPMQAKKLPKSVTIFTVIQLPPAELMFLRQLAQYVDVALLHYNPSQEYWADLVDSRWLQRRQSERGLSAENDIAIQGRETHPLLTRMGKQSRDVFKLLVQLAGGEFTGNVQEVWQDAFVVPEIAAEQPEEPTLLANIQQHALNLSNVKDWQFDPNDQSIAIHSCYSTLRQLEVLREEMIQWLGADVPAHERRIPADILVLVPDLKEAAPLIRAVFPTVSLYDEHAEINVPVEITGLASPEVEALWQALTGRFNLLAGRLPCETLLDWLDLTPVQQSYGLSSQQVTRIGELLVEAGFRRGFDAVHLAQTLTARDVDVRFTLRFALDRLLLGIAMPVNTLYAGCLPLTTLLRDDFELVATIEQIYQDLHRYREQLSLQHPVKAWVELLRTDLREAFAAERDTRGWGSITQALDDLVKNAAEDVAVDQGVIQLPLRFVLEELEASLTQAMQSSVPTGKVTFARLGTMRPLPYRVIAVLNLDTGKFPKREQKNTFDLIGAFPSQLGDRSRAEDDLGAFLDALLLASDACWLFYNGRDVQDDQPRLPAAPVQELIDFLRDHIALLPALDDATKKISAVDQYIHHEHTVLPFEQDNFNALHPLSSGGVWFDVARQLNRTHGVSSQAEIWAETAAAESTDNILIKADQLIKDLIQPARYFMAQARIGRVYLEEGLSPFEPLTLNKLNEYQLRNQFQVSKQNQQALRSSQWVAALPIGVAGDAYWRKGEREQRVIEQRMLSYGGVASPLTERVLSFESLVNGVMKHWQVAIRIPEDEREVVWLSQSASSGRGKHRLRFWIEHLLWQIKRGTTEQDVSLQFGKRIGVYRIDTLVAEPIIADQAQTYLADWLHVWRIAAQQPFVLPPNLAIEAFSLDKTDHVKVKDFEALSKKWLGDDFNAFLPPNQNEDCVLHPDWQLILQGQNPVEAFAHYFDVYAERLYVPILRHVRVDDGQGEAG